MSQFPPLTPSHVGSRRVGYARPIPLHRTARAFNDSRAIGNPAPVALGGSCPAWLDIAAKAFIVFAAVLSVAMWVAF